MAMKDDDLRRRAQVDAQPVSRVCEKCLVPHAARICAVAHFRTVFHRQRRDATASALFVHAVKSICGTFSCSAFQLRNMRFV